MSRAVGNNPLKLSEPRLPILVTGGAGFIGMNVARWLLDAEYRVVVLDDLSRRGGEDNLRTLRSHPRADQLEIHVADVRQEGLLRQLVPRVSAVFHFAAQVAVTQSFLNPIHDYEVNVGGTLKLLEAVRGTGRRLPFLFTSTNKVYGSLEHISLQSTASRYEPAPDAMNQEPVAERPLTFHSPYGCSKGAADQYVLDYARSYGLPTIVFRMSCIYGPHQRGTEDQGWVGHFVRSVLEDKPVRLYGDGRQVRDLLFVDDLIEALCVAMAKIDMLWGGAFNIGGGPAHTVSLLELMNMLQRMHGRQPDVIHEPWRPGDQRYYVSDYARFAELTGWQPRVDVDAGVARVYRWMANDLVVASGPHRSVGSMA